MGVWHNLETAVECPKCGPFEKIFQFKYGGVEHGVTYKIGDCLRWNGVPKGVRDSRLKYWPLFESADCPSCGKSAAYAHALVIVGDVIESVFWLPPDGSELAGLPPVALLLAVEEYGYQAVRVAAEREGWIEHLAGWTLPKINDDNILEAEWTCPGCARARRGSVPLRYGPTGPYAFRIGERVDWSQPGPSFRLRDRRVAYIQTSLPLCDCSYEGGAVIVVGGDKIEELYVLPKDLWGMAASPSLPEWVRRRGTSHEDYEAPPAIHVYLLVRQYGENLAREELQKLPESDRFSYIEWNLCVRLAAKETGLSNVVALQIGQSVEWAVSCPSCGKVRMTLPFLYGDQRPHRTYRPQDEITWGGGPLDHCSITGGGTRDDRLKYVFLHGDWQTCQACAGMTMLGREPAVIVKNNRISEVRLSPLRSTARQSEMDGIGYSYELGISQRERLLLVEAFGADELARSFVGAFNATLAATDAPWPEEAWWRLRRRMFALLGGFDIDEVGSPNRLEFPLACPRCARQDEISMEFPYGPQLGSAHRVGEKIDWQADAPMSVPRDPRVAYVELSRRCSCGFDTPLFVTVATDVIESVSALPDGVGRLDPGWLEPGKNEGWRRPWHDGESWNHRMFLLIRQYGWERVKATASTIPAKYRYGSELDFRLAET